MQHVVYQPDLQSNGLSLFEVVDTSIRDEKLNNPPEGHICRKSSRLAGSVNWLPKNLMDLVDKYKPCNDTQISSCGMLDKVTLTENCTSLVNDIKDKIGFVNIYQFKQVFERFGGYWGFMVTQNGKFTIKCFYGNKVSCDKKKDTQSEISNKSRDRVSFKNDCPFCVNATFLNKSDRKNKTLPRHLMSVQLTSYDLSHGPCC